jgi:MoxR-like ATPase
MQAFFEQQSIDAAPASCQLAGCYLVDELKRHPLNLTVSAAAHGVAEAFIGHLDSSGQRVEFDGDLRQLEANLGDQYRLVAAWLGGFDLWRQQNAAKEGIDPDVLIEAIGLVLVGDRLERTASSAETRAVAEGLFGQHGRIEERRLEVRIDEFLDRLTAHHSQRVPAYRAYREMRQQVVEQEKAALRLEEFKPRALTSFVRNRLIDQVYLPMVGDNLSKQMGALGANKRTDQMGMLLLISPPGYGKTTLMEYIANRLGLVFMKINCPAVGHDTTSIDPASAPNATARQELEKLNLGLEMANNVMLYLDDIQHTNPEFLQKFISLADGQRKIEGVWRGQTRTYDLRGKKFCVIMAGNPYTESGEAFKIPDMLANRADIYNLGDVLGGKEEAFAMSYIENALTSNQVLAPLANRELEDVYRFVRQAKGEEVAATDFSYDYSATERNEIIGVIKKLLRVQQVVLKVNLQYIASAAQQDAYRTEPPFKLQGSYRNMNKMAEKVVAIMNDEELERLIDDHYRGEAQTLTTGAEENLLKLGDLRGTLKGEQLERWEEIKKGYRRIQSGGGEEADPATRVANQLSGIAINLETLNQGITGYADREGEHRRGQSELNGLLLQSLVGVSEGIELLQQRIEEHGAKGQEANLYNVKVMARFLKDLRMTVERAQMNVQVVNKPVPGMQIMLEQLTKAYDETLLPLMKSLHHKLTLDEAIWRQVNESRKMLHDIDKRIFSEGVTINESFKPMKKKSGGKESK